MLTYRKAKQRLPVGDIVYTVENGTVFENTVKSIFADGLKTIDGYFLYFDEVGDSWFLTEKVAKENALRTVRRL